ncbi:hypothetical protein Zm00014a_005654 [Zea mays]|jgi:hypothetical protein|uniref:Uncharacterized protein n=1 Tax=Zea mays TaxID=4577 RepID=A0A3L6G6P4_MAIZE|nr:hypothetical protein Zm00014a_005654 [Zea mays]
MHGPGSAIGAAIRSFGQQDAEQKFNARREMLHVEETQPAEENGSPAMGTGGQQGATLGDSAELGERRP